MTVVRYEYAGRWLFQELPTRNARKGIPLAAQKVHQSLPFRPIRMERDVHSVAMIEAPAIMDCALAKNRNRQLLFERS